MLGGLKTIFPIRHLAKHLAHGKHVTKGANYRPDLTKRDLIYHWEAQRQLCRHQGSAGRTSGFSMLDSNPAHSQGSRKGRTCSPDPIPGPTQSFFEAAVPSHAANLFLCIQALSPTHRPTNAPSKQRFLVFFLIHTGEDSFYGNFLFLKTMAL